MSSLSGGARRAKGARRKEAGQLEQHLLIQSITNGLALATGQEDGYCVSRPAKGPWRTGRGARAHVGENRARNAPRSRVRQSYRLKALLAGHCLAVATVPRLDTGSFHHLTPKACRA